MAMRQYVDVVITGATRAAGQFWLMFSGLWRDTGAWIDEEKWTDGD